jgi:ribonucleoside-diphosphate reductase alpha chain
VRRVLTRAGSPFELVGWGRRSVQITDRDGCVAFACEDVEAPISWSNLAVAVVARRYFAREPGLAPERSVRALTERVVEAIAGWAQDAGHAVDAAQHATLRDELAALVMTQRATFATPVWLNAGLAEHPLTSACFRSTAATLGPAGLQPLITRARSGIRRERLRLAAWVPLASLAVVP